MCLSSCLLDVSSWMSKFLLQTICSEHVLILFLQTSSIYSLIALDSSFIFPRIEDKNHGVTVTSSLSNTSLIPDSYIFKIYPDSNCFLPPSQVPHWSKLPTCLEYTIISCFPWSHPFPLLSTFNTTARVILLQHRSSVLLLCSNPPSLPILLKVKAKAFIRQPYRIWPCYFSDPSLLLLPYLTLLQPHRPLFFFEPARHNLAFRVFALAVSIT